MSKRGNHCGGCKKPCVKEKRKLPKSCKVKDLGSLRQDRYVLSPVNLCVFCDKVQEGIVNPWQNGAVTQRLSDNIEKAGLRFNYVACPQCSRENRKNPVAVILLRVELMRKNGNKTVAMTKILVP